MTVTSPPSCWSRSRANTASSCRGQATCGRCGALCDQHGVALILDEIQTGLGAPAACLPTSTGRAPRCSVARQGAGRGLFPVAACLFAEGFCDPDFALHQSSTFANNNLACAAGLAVLHELSPSEGCGLVAAAEQHGAQLQTRLAGLAQRFPRSIAAVRGRGLFAAIDLQPAQADDGFLFGYLSEQGLLAYATAALFAEECGVLLLPSLSSRHTLRIAPPLIVDSTQIEALCSALEHVLPALEGRCSARLAPRAGGATRETTLHVSRSPVPTSAPASVPASVQTSIQAGLPTPVHLPLPLLLEADARHPATNTRRRYAFLIHYSQPQDIVTTDPDLADLSAGERAAYLRFMSALPAGCVLRAPLVRSRLAAEAEGLSDRAALPEQMLRAGRARVRGQIQRAVDLAARLGLRWWVWAASRRRIRDAAWMCWGAVPRSPPATA